MGRKQRLGQIFYVQCMRRSPEALPNRPSRDWPRRTSVYRALVTVTRWHSTFRKSWYGDSTMTKLATKFAHSTPTIEAVESRIALMETAVAAARLRIAETGRAHRTAVAAALIDGNPRPVCPGLDAEKAALATMIEDISALGDQIPLIRRAALETEAAALVVHYSAMAEKTRLRTEAALTVSLLSAIHLQAGECELLALANSALDGITRALRAAGAPESTESYPRSQAVFHLGAILRRLEADPQSSEAERKGADLAQKRIDAADARLTVTDLAAIIARAERIYSAIKPDLGPVA